MTTNTPTVADRLRRDLRTVITITLAVASVLLVILPVVVDALEPVLPPAWYAWLAGVAATVVGVAAAIQRIMTSPQVEALLQRFLPGLAANPPADPAVDAGSVDL